MLHIYLQIQKMYISKTIHHPSKFWTEDIILASRMRIGNNLASKLHVFNNNTNDFTHF